MRPAKMSAPASGVPSLKMIRRTPKSVPGARLEIGLAPCFMDRISMLHREVKGVKLWMRMTASGTGLRRKRAFLIAFMILTWYLIDSLTYVLLLPERSQLPD